MRSRSARVQLLSLDITSSSTTTAKETPKRSAHERVRIRKRPICPLVPSCESHSRPFRSLIPPSAVLCSRLSIVYATFMKRPIAARCVSKCVSCVS